MSQPAAAHDLSRLRIERGEPRPLHRRLPRWLLALALLLLALGGAHLAGLFEAGAEVRIGRVVRSAGATAVQGTAANGYVVARRQAALSTDIQGRLVELRVEEGDHVQAGDLIARLDTRELEATRERLRAELATAEAQAEWARLDLERKQPLLEQGDVSRSDVDFARVERDRTAAQVEALRAALAEAEVQLSRSSVFAPFAGVITARNAEVGEVVSSLSAGANAVGSVATLVDFDTLEVQIELSQTALKAAREGAPVLIFLDAWPDRGYRGRVRQIWPTADREKFTVELRAEFLERDERILPEMRVRVVFTADESVAPPEPEVLLPAAALGADGAHVFVVEQGRALRRAVRTGGAAGDGRLRVLEGLEGGETVVLDPPAGLADGAAVSVREPGA